MNADYITYDENGLIPAIVQDETTGNVLMLAYMNKEALEKTLATKETWFYSRSREDLWHKVATSGNLQTVSSVTLDCDQDALLVTVHPEGPACHTGKTSCFHHPIMEQTAKRDVIHTIIETIEERKQHPVEGAYTSYLFQEGIDKVLKKVGEETSEVIIGAKNRDKEEIIWEISDLIYHTLVLMNITDVQISDIKQALSERHLAKSEAQHKHE